MSWWDDALNEGKDEGGNALGSLYGKGSTFQGIGNALGFGPGDHSADNAAKGLVDQSIHGYDGMKPPDLGQVNLQGGTYAGDISAPTVNVQGAAAANEGPSAMGGIVTDPRLREAQMASLAQMQDLGAKGGMTDADTANLARIQSQSANADTARRNSILQNMQQRGMGGSGAELMAQLSSSQAATDRQAQSGLDVAGMAQQRALQAMQQSGQMAGQMQGADYSQKANAAAAQDAISRFNAQNQTGINQFNASAQNQGAFGNAQLGMAAQEHNQGARQGVNNMNTGIANQQTMYNQSELPQKTWQDQMAIKQGQQQALGGGIGYYGHKGDQAAAAQGNRLGATIGGLGALGKFGANKYMAGGSDAAGGSETGLAGAGGGGGAGEAYGGGDAAGSAAEDVAMAWKGGRVPGMAPVPGNSPVNDMAGMTVRTSPGEVILPRSAAASPAKAADFVKHAPPILPADKQKEAMLSALRNIHRRTM